MGVAEAALISLPSVPTLNGQNKLKSFRALESLALPLVASFLSTQEENGAAGGPGGQQVRGGGKQALLEA